MKDTSIAKKKHSTPFQQAVKVWVTEHIYGNSIIKFLMSSSFNILIAWHINASKDKSKQVNIKKSYKILPKWLHCEALF
jgi:hypothetical protein